MYRPLRSNCVVQIEKGDEISKGGIILSMAGSKDDMAREEGILLSIGPDFFYESDVKEQVKVGDKVVFARYGGKALGKDKDGFELRVLRDIDLLAVEEGE